MSTVYVSNSTELQFALSKAIGGDEIILAEGDYGTLQISESFSTPLTIRGGNSTFDELLFDGAENIVIDDVDCTGGIWIGGGSSGIEVHNSSFEEGAYIVDSRDVTLHSNSITTSGQKALIIGSGAREIDILYNDIFEAESDLIQISGDVSGVLISGNVIRDPVPIDPAAHPDLIQVFSYGGTTPSNITISANLLYDDPATGLKGAQGIFLSDGNYENVLIEQNLVYASMTNGITINAAIGNVLVKDNTLLSGVLRASEKGSYTGNDDGAVEFSGNIARNYYNPENDVDFSKNYFFFDEVGKNQIFNDASDPTNYSAFLPASGSEIDFGSSFGAQEFLLSLLDNGYDEPNVNPNTDTSPQ